MEQLDEEALLVSGTLAGAAVGAAGGLVAARVKA